MTPKIVSKSPVLTCSRQHLLNKNKENLVKSTGMVLTKYRPKVKLENFHNSRVPKLGGNYAYLDL